MSHVFVSSACIQAAVWLYGLSIFSKIMLFLGLIAATTHYCLSPPPELRRFKKVSPYATLWSYATGESVDRRMIRLLLPFAEKGDGAVAVYMLGKWAVHLIDPTLIQEVCSEPGRFPKKNYQEHLHFTFLSGPNVVFSNGEQWKRHSASVKGAFDRNIPVHVFAELSQEVLCKIGKGGTQMNWTELMQRFALDVIGKAALGHEFASLNSLSHDGLPFVEHFNRVMSNIATPMRLMFPLLDIIFPRQGVIDDINALNARYDRLLKEKREKPGQDVLSNLLDDRSLSHEELRSNLAILFSAGHDTTSGALSTATYYLSLDPVLQSAVRDEVRSIMPHNTEPTLADLKRLSLLDAVIRESLRINPPISLLPARVCLEDTILGSYVLPKNVSIVPNICVVHHNNRIYPNASTFVADRFMASSKAGEAVKHNAAIFIPFGMGPRQCPARQFSLFEQKTLLALLLRRYEFRLPKGSQHTTRLKNEFAAFGLSVPHALDIEVKELRER